MPDAGLGKEGEPETRDHKHAVPPIAHHSQCEHKHALLKGGRWWVAAQCTSEMVFRSPP